MIRFCVRVAGQPVQINVLDCSEDIPEFVSWVRENKAVLGVDAESTGLDWWSKEFRLRTVQFGNADESYMVPVELSKKLLDAAVGALRHIEILIFQNGTYDLLVLNATTNIMMEELWPKVRDTKIYAHLVDSRGVKEGGTGHSLEALTKAYIDNDIAAKIKGSMAEIARSMRTTKDRVWSEVDVFHGGYMTYAGLDPILAYRLFFTLRKLLPQSVWKKSLISPEIGYMNLPEFEHRVAEVCSYMSREGIRLDVEYTKSLIEKLSDYESEWTQVARDCGVANLWSNAQLAEHWKNLTFTEFTPTGLPKIDKDFLAARERAGDVLAMAVIRAKSARKRRTTWLENFLNQVDSSGLIHPSINSIQAVTARMSIQGIPAQTLPAGEAEIRDCFLADVGHVIVSTDYSNMELRFLAAWSGDERMLKAFREGEDLHQVTADGAGVSRKVGKMTNFLTVFGGGPGALASQAKIDPAKAVDVLESFKRTFPGVAEFMEEKTKEARKNGYITTSSGRRLYVDRKYAFRGTNYFVQSGSRDVTCRALLRLHHAGLGPYMLLPIHDEILFSIPEDHSKYGAAMTGRLMEEVVQGLMIPTDPEIALESWGSLYYEEGSKH